MLGRKNRYAGYRNFVLEGNDAETEKFYSRGNIGSIYGDMSFRQSIQEDKENLQVSRDLPSVLSDRPEIEAIVEAVAVVFKVDMKSLTVRRKGRPQSNVGTANAANDCMRFMVCTKCQRQRDGRRRMLRYEGYRKAVYRKTVRTV